MVAICLEVTNNSIIRISILAFTEQSKTNKLNCLDCSRTYIGHVEVLFQLEVIPPLTAALWFQGVQCVVCEDREDNIILSDQQDKQRLDQDIPI